MQTSNWTEPSFTFSPSPCGWIEGNAGAYRVTDEGKRIRDEAEALTDQYFFAPWSCLNESELEELASLASQLRDGLKKP